MKLIANKKSINSPRNLMKERRRVSRLRKTKKQIEAWQQARGIR